MKRIISVFTVLLTASICFYACNKTDNGGSGDSSVVNGFDKTSMLNTYADQLIIPGYTALQSALASFQTEADRFATTPSVTTQANAKEAYTELHLQYARVAAFQFGPAETELLDLFLNFSGGLDYSFTTAGQLTGFSIDTQTIEANIVSGNYNLTTMSRNSFYSQGFPALNYLLFEPNAIARFSNNAIGRKKYLDDVIARMKTLIDKVAIGWADYKPSFIANTKTNVGSPIGNIVNQMAYQLDLLKGPRIGWPLGKQSNNIVFAEKCEAYYAGISAQLAVENLVSLKNFYTAKNTGKGISDYLVALEQTQLNTDVLAQFDLAINKLKTIPDPMSGAFVTHASDIDGAYKEVQKLLTLIKTDVASATAVQITFMDNDGD